jgi:hypothetical protein
MEALKVKVIVITGRSFIHPWIQDRLRIEKILCQNLKFGDKSSSTLSAGPLTLGYGIH